VLVPCVAPKFVPVIVTEVPTAPDVGLRLVMLGGGGAAVPVPVSGMDIGTMLALFATSRLPVLEPVPDGEKVTLTVQLLPTANGNDAAQVSVSEKSPTALATIVFIGPVEVFVSVTCWGALFVPAACAAKLREAGEAISRGGKTMTGMLRGKLVAPWP